MATEEGVGHLSLSLPRTTELSLISTGRYQRWKRPDIHSVVFHL